MTVTFNTRPFKAAFAWIGVYLFRLLPFRPGNFEPMLATMMPFSKRFGFFSTFAFGFLGIVLYDAVTAGFGAWTFVTAAAYGVLGIASHFYFKNRSATCMHFLAFGIVGTVLYDLVTLMVGPLFFAQPLMLAIVGQIPFTLMHLLGTALFTVSLSVALDGWFAKNEQVSVRLSLTKLPVLVTVSE